MRILIIFIAGFSFIKGSQGQRTNYCSPNTPVVDVCVDDSANSTRNGVYINSGSSPRLQATECTCIITPVTTRQISVKLQTKRMSEDAANFEFNIQHLTINNFISALNISKETKLVYTSSDNSTGGTCIWIGPVSDKGMFTVTCFRQIHSTTGLTKSSTASDRTRSTDETQPTNGGHINTQKVTTTYVDQHKDTTTKDKTKTSQNESKHNDTNWTLLAAIIGGTVGVVVLVVIITGIVCCKRKAKESNDVDNNTHKNDVDDDNDDDDEYGMRINPIYEHYQGEQ